MRKIAKFAIIDGGVDWPDYWQGHGIAGTDFDATFTGIGATPLEAYEDAVEQAAQAGWDTEDGTLPEVPQEIQPVDVEAEDYLTDANWYVSIDLKSM